MKNIHKQFRNRENQMYSLFHDELVESNRIIYTPSDFAKSSLFHLQETGTLQAKFPHTSSRTNLSSYLFYC